MKDSYNLHLTLLPGAFGVLLSVAEMTIDDHWLPLVTNVGHRWTVQMHIMPHKEVQFESVLLIHFSYHHFAFS